MYAAAWRSTRYNGFSLRRLRRLSFWPYEPSLFRPSKYHGSLRFSSLYDEWRGLVVQAQKLQAFIALALIAMIIVSGTYYILSLRRQTALSVVPNAALVYEIAPEYIPLQVPYPSTTLHQNASLTMWLLANYSTVLQQEKGSTVYLDNFTHECIISSHVAYLTLRVLNQSKELTYVNSTLTFWDGNARCGTQYGSLPRSSWKLVGGEYTSSFNTLNMTRLMVVNDSSSGTRSTTGYPYGEWPFWLSSNDLKQKYTLVLFRLIDSGANGWGVNREADIIPVNLSESAPSPYSFQGTEVNQQDQIYVSKGMLPIEWVYHNVPAEVAAYYVPFWMGANAHCCASPPGARYASSNMELNPGTVWSNLTVRYKSWSWEPGLFTQHSLQPIATPNGTGLYNTTIMWPGIAYSNTSYPTAGFPELDNASYSRTSGILLYANIQGGWVAIPTRRCPRRSLRSGMSRGPPPAP